MKIAIVGTGVAGLVAAHLLHPEHEITVYEASERVGGHSHTVEVEGEGDGESHWIDTGFIVFNDRNYPNFERLLEELEVPIQPSHMGFSVSDGSGRFEYSGTPRGIFARKSHLLSPAFLGILRDWRRFNREAQALIGMNGTAPSLGRWLEEQGFWVRATTGRTSPSAPPTPRCCRGAAPPGDAATTTAPSRQAAAPPSPTG